MKDYESLTITKEVGCGNVYLIFTEDEHLFHKLFIRGDMAKECPCGESFLNAIAKLLTYALRRSFEEENVKEAIIKQLLGHRCSMIIPNKEHIVSCSDAIAKAVLEYAKSRGWIEENEKE